VTAHLPRTCPAPAPHPRAIPFGRPLFRSPVPPFPRRLPIHESRRRRPCGDVACRTDVQQGGVFGPAAGGWGCPPATYESGGGTYHEQSIFSVNEPLLFSVASTTIQYVSPATTSSAIDVWLQAMHSLEVQVPPDWRIR